ncbi:hypothetical protein [Kitasatospora sp. NPDC089509]|uniref:hypothetical protein n=1 Tax=Kitasatospora sp. NPDC089509 TaxID=3364079 RepID=UPI00381420C1
MRALSAVLAGRPDPALAEALTGLLESLRRAATEVLLVSTGESIPAEATARSKLNREAGRARAAQVHQRVSRCLVTPVDREDLLRVSRAVVGGIHALHEFIRETEMYRPQSPDRLVPLAQGIVRAVDRLCRTIADVMAGEPMATDRLLDCQLAIVTLDREHRQQMAALFQDRTTTESLKLFALLGRLDLVRERLLQACDSLADGVVKRGL